MHAVFAHTGALPTWHVRFASQYAAGATQLPGPPVQGAVQVSPHDFPWQPSLDEHVAMPLLHMPLSQPEYGHALEPSGHCWQATAATGQSASVRHAPGHPGNTYEHCPLMHSY